MNKVIFHIDMDTFFVSCERKMNPNLKNKPLAISKNNGHLIAMSLSYELKKAGLKAGETVYKIKQTIPNVTFVEPHYDLYSLSSEQIFAFLKENYTDELEIYSIDECFLNATKLIKYPGHELILAKEIQARLLNEMDFPCSIGVSGTRFLAKMSTNLAKPFGVKQININDIEAELFDLPIEDVFGIGKKSAYKLKELNINTYGELINYPDQKLLESKFGRNYLKLINEMKGCDIDSIVTQNFIKGIGNSRTFEQGSLIDEDDIWKELKIVALTVINRAINRNEKGNIVGISFRINKKWIDYTKKFNIYFNEQNLFINTIYALFKEHWDSKKINGVGVKLSGLKSNLDLNENYDIFDIVDEDRKVNQIIKSTNAMIDVKNKLITAKDYLFESNKKHKNPKFATKDVVRNKIKINL
ncbi:DNA polymerase IV [Metamycoplasma cloacale]|uniref:DNA polymerase IV n=1 Tax=Metamycoplasma cloacale TaxID=92401 RepID=A0A2Z4LNA3_9BACT|nr:DNA polymerase IV [Metamycoplasma cloacale]AWX42737.1 DNA polymerase IV [Metamycoplasma cloacale]VEU79449.1 DNA polymerase IV [Metamycoplasma cloacale]